MWRHLALNRVDLCDSESKTASETNSSLSGRGRDTVLEWPMQSIVEPAMGRKSKEK